MSPRWNPTIWTFFFLVPLGAAQQQPSQQPSGQQQQQPSQQQQQPGQQSGQQGAGGASSNGANSNGNTATCSGGANNNKPAPLFCGSLRITKGRQTGDNTALGFNGVDPNGQVQKAVLGATATADSVKKVQGMAAYRPGPMELAGFQKDGGLTLATPGTTQPNAAAPAKQP